MAEYILDAINSISKGRSTRLRIGSRSIPHRLNKIEKEALERSELTGFLEVYEWNRQNIENIYEKLCNAKGRPILICKHYKDYSVLEIIEKEELSTKTIFKSRKEAKTFAKKYLFDLRQINLLN